MENCGYDSVTRYSCGWLLVDAHKKWHSRIRPAQSQIKLQKHWLGSFKAARISQID